MQNSSSKKLKNKTLDELCTQLEKVLIRLDSEGKLHQSARDQLADV